MEKINLFEIAAEQMDNYQQNYSNDFPTFDDYMEAVIQCASVIAAEQKNQLYLSYI